MDTKTSFEAQVRVDPLSNDSGIGYSRLTPCKLNTLTKSFPGTYELKLEINMDVNMNVKWGIESRVEVDLLSKN